MALSDHRRMAIHTFTTKPWSLSEALAGYQRAGVPAITIWRQHIETIGIDAAAKMVADAGLKVPALCRGGFFPAVDASARSQAIDDNKRAIDEAAALGADMVVLVVGAVPGMPLAEARKQVADGIAACLDHAEAAGVKLAIEPLHPMYAGDKSCVTSMRQARAIWSELEHPLVGVAVDVYHVWFDAELEEEIKLAGADQRLFGFHVCDWKCDTNHLLLDRGPMGEGCIDIAGIRAQMEAAGFDGWIEVEIFSTTHWSKIQADYVEEIKRAYLAHC